MTHEAPLHGGNVGGGVVRVGDTVTWRSNAECAEQHLGTLHSALLGDLRVSGRARGRRPG